MYVLLSHRFTEQTPAPGGRTALSIQVDESLDAGAVGNTFYYTLWNHAGTHIDGPAHMVPNAVSVADLPVDYFVFAHPCVLDVPKEDGELIFADDLSREEALIRNCDLLLLRTGFERHRSSDPVRYRDKSPGLSVDVARYLSAERFGSVRAIGIDTISMACPLSVEEGVEAHRILFSRTGPQPLVLIEDMSLGCDLSLVRRVFALPLYVRGLDSCPCTVLGVAE